MIGSHNSFTYLPSTNWLYNRFQRLWRTQCKSIEEQYKFGIRFFDIRVYKEGNMWRLCHGAVNLSYYRLFSLHSLCNLFDTCYPDALYRIILEKGDTYDILNEAGFQDPANLCACHPNLWRVDIKNYHYYKGYVCNNNQALYDKGYKFALDDTWVEPSHELRGYVHLKTAYKDNLRKQAMKINNGLSIFANEDALKQAIESKDELWLIDYSTNEY